MIGDTGGRTVVNRAQYLALILALGKEGIDKIVLVADPVPPVPDFSAWEPPKPTPAEYRRAARMRRRGDSILSMMVRLGAKP